MHIYIDYIYTFVYANRNPKFERSIHSYAFYTPLPLQGVLGIMVRGGVSLSMRNFRQYGRRRD